MTSRVETSAQVHRRRPTSVLAALRWFVVSYGFAVLGYLVINAVASRWLGLADFTDFVIVVTASTVVGQLALLGVHRGGLREAAVMGAEDESRLRGLRGGARGAVLVTVPVGSVLSALVVYAITGGSPSHRVVLGIGFGLLVYF